jgi:hypothetical protein
MNVIIPEKFFFEEAQKEYYNIAARLIAELIQNSYDAKATEIRLTFDESGYSCEDNGKGMSKDEMISSMLTLGGSHKSAGATGGFGAAKKIILFAHKSYEIHSRDFKAVGSVLEYNFVDCENRNGTKVSAKYLDEFPHEKMESEAISFLEKSRLENCKVFINGRQFSNWKNFGEKIEGTNIWDVYLSDGTSYYINVYHNGLFMFQRYVGTIKKTISVNVKVPSSDVFAQNRGCFIGQADTQFDNFSKRIITNPNIGFARIFKTIIYRGIKKAIDKIKEDTNYDKSNETVNAIVGLNSQESSEIESVVRNNPSIREQKDLIAALNNSGYEETAKKVSELNGEEFKVNYDFYLSIDDGEKESDYINLIKDSKYKFVASLYQVCINEIMRIENDSQEFYIGFCFDDEALSKRDNKFKVFYINPSEFIKCEDFKKMCCKIMARAMHEYVHIKNGDHDDQYASHLTKLMEDVLICAKPYDDLVELAISEQNKNI